MRHTALALLAATMLAALQPVTVEVVTSATTA